MAITRRQFVTRLGALAAATGMGQADLAKITQAFAHGNTLWATKKPKVVWVHGAECTGCSTSLLGLFENAGGLAVEDTRLTDPFALGGVTTGAALGLVGNLSGSAIDDPHGHRSITSTRAVTGVDFDGEGNANTAAIVNIADVLIDFIDLQYHETVMGSGGDLAYQWLADNMYNGSADAFVLVVEGAVQVTGDTAAWAGETTGVPWCSIGMDANAHNTPVDYAAGANGVQTRAGELPFDEVVELLAKQATGIIAIGQCACYGGYPAAESPFYGDKQTPAFGVYDFLAQSALTDEGPDFFKSTAMSKVINVPGCPTNPWWFVLTTVLFLVDAVNGPFKSTGAVDGPLGILGSNGIPKATAIDYGRRLKHVYGTPVHGPACPRYKSFTAGAFAENPGDDGCLLNLGCKGPATNSLCSLHGWNGRQPRNTATWDYDVAADQGNKRGGFCVTAGHPCMGCTEKGYPDSYVPFVNR
ncbi:MAG: hypothetical protein Q8K89_10285 [Actinomycetota bacterium]|nr:hypothetical protein [Actinomycetota bacterium]